MGPVGQRQDDCQGDALLDTDQSHDDKGGGGQCKLDAVETQDGPQLAGSEQLGGDEHQGGTQGCLR